MKWVSMVWTPYLFFTEVYIGVKHCFSLIIDGFCSSNAFNSSRLSFRMFVFLLAPFDTKDCYFFESSLSLVLLIKVLLIKKHVNLLFEERTLPQVFLLLGISLGRYHQVLSHKGKKGDGRRMAIQHDSLKTNGLFKKKFIPFFFMLSNKLCEITSFAILHNNVNFRCHLVYDPVMVAYNIFMF